MSRVHAVLTTLLRPAILFAVRSGLKVQDIFEVLKEVCVRVAAEELQLRNENVSKSKISVMTGLQRRDVTWFLEHEAESPRAANILTKIIGQWREDPRFSSKSKPHPLTIEGTQSQFFKLVTSVSKDLNPYAVLFELERTGAVERKDDRLQLVVQTYEVKENLDEGLTLWSLDAEDLMTSVEENIIKRADTPNLHIATRYDNIVVSSLPKIRAWLLEQGAKFHAQARHFLSQYDKDLNPTLYKEKSGVKVSLTSFSRTIHSDENTEVISSAVGDSLSVQKKGNKRP